jgi:hypothetical protein
LKVAENFYRGTKSWYVTGGLDFDKRVIDEEDDNKEVLDDISQKLRKIRTNFHVLMRHNVISLHEISGSKSVTLKKLP